MPEVHFTVLLPGGLIKQCYSPSRVVQSYFAEGEQMTLTDFVDRSRLALSEASKRVQAKYGFTCSSAAAQLEEIEQWGRSHRGDATIQIVKI